MAPSLIHCRGLRLPILSQETLLFRIGNVSDELVKLFRKKRKQQKLQRDIQLGLANEWTHRGKSHQKSGAALRGSWLGASFTASFTAHCLHLLGLYMTWAQPPQPQLSKISHLWLRAHRRQENYSNDGNTGNNRYYPNEPQKSTNWQMLIKTYDQMTAALQFLMFSSIRMLCIITVKSTTVRWLRLHRPNI